jgi:potassium-transporting ATPase KdpC subunit
MIKIAIRAALAVAVLAGLCGLAYPAAMTGLAQLTMRSKADGSLVQVDGRDVASSKIGQVWKGHQWFYGRPSAVDYDASTSSGSNLGPNNSDLEKSIAARARKILGEENPYTPGLTIRSIPAELLTSSASGLDPDISEAGALFQVPRIAAVRHLPEDSVRSLVEQHVQGPQLGFLGQSRVNVLELNVALEQMSQ